MTLDIDIACACGGNTDVDGFCCACGRPNFDEPEEPEEEWCRCPSCDGPATLLGDLGHLRHLRCRDCGWEWSRDL